MFGVPNMLRTGQSGNKWSDDSTRVKLQWQQSREYHPDINVITIEAPADVAVSGSTGTLSGLLSLNTLKSLAGAMGALTGALSSFLIAPPTPGHPYISIRVPVGYSKRGPRFVYVPIKSSALYSQSVSGSMGTVSGNLINKTLKALSGSSGSLTGNLSRNTLKALSGAAGALTGALSRVTNKVLSGTMGNLTGALSTSLVYFKSLAGTMGSLTGELTRRTNKALSGAPASLTGVLSRFTTKTFTGVFSGSGSVSRITGKLLDGPIVGLSGELSRKTYKILSGAISSLSAVLTAFKPTIYLVSLSGAISSLYGSVSIFMQVRRARIKAGYSVSKIQAGAAVQRTITTGSSIIRTIINSGSRGR